MLVNLNLAHWELAASGNFSRHSIAVLMRQMRNDVWPPIGDCCWPKNSRAWNWDSHYWNPLDCASRRGGHCLRIWLAYHRRRRLPCSDWEMYSPSNRTLIIPYSNKFVTSLSSRTRTKNLTNGSTSWMLLEISVNHNQTHITHITFCFWSIDTFPQNPACAPALSRTLRMVSLIDGQYFSRNFPQSLPSTSVYPRGHCKQDTNLTLHSFTANKIYFSSRNNSETEFWSSYLEFCELALGVCCRSILQQPTVEQVIKITE